MHQSQPQQTATFYVQSTQPISTGNSSVSASVQQQQSSVSLKPTQMYAASSSISTPSPASRVISQHQILTAAPDLGFIAAKPVSAPPASPTAVVSLKQQHPPISSSSTASKNNVSANSALAAQIASMASAASSSASSSQWSCDNCGKIFSSRSNMVAHSKIHTGERPYVCTELDCGRNFVKKSNLTRHMLIHTGDKPFECADCGKKFRQRRNLSRHKTIHSQEKPYECTQCGWKFRRRSNLLTHFRIHTGEKPFICDICGKSFRQRGSLSSHIHTHSQEKAFECSVCGEKLSRLSSLRRHNRSFHPEIAHKLNEDFEDEDIYESTTPSPSRRNEDEIMDDEDEELVDGDENYSGESDRGTENGGSNSRQHHGASLHHVNCNDDGNSSPDSSHRMRPDNSVSTGSDSHNNLNGNDQGAFPSSPSGTLSGVNNSQAMSRRMQEMEETSSSNQSSSSYSVNTHNKRQCRK
eukprot:TRINITY_DN7280_c0_g2_i1.p1 TRINITY_DN7280_c0_g2~~TRINITY_DN7280_c0_g2_i1.p1  ORF type:complete len:467 (-),score=70.72 TRINITY_DN7280_c0_g2_i1:30-1430(-)